MTVKPAYLVDFDGTVTTEDISYELAVQLAGEGYDEIDRVYRNKEITIREWLWRTVKLLPPDREMLLSKSFNWTSIRPGFERFLEHARSQGSPVIVASDGFGFYIEPILEKSGLLDQVTTVYRNDTVLNHEGRLEVKMPHAHSICPVCGNCKAFHVVNLKKQGYPVIYVGDGSNDRYGASWGDHVCAREQLLQYSRKYNFAHSPWDDFYDIINVGTPELQDCSESSLCCPLGRGVKE